MRRAKSQYFCCNRLGQPLKIGVPPLISHSTEWVVRKLEVQWDPLESGCTTAILVVQWC